VGRRFLREGCEPRKIDKLHQRRLLPTTSLRGRQWGGHRRKATCFPFRQGGKLKLVLEKACWRLKSRPRSSRDRKQPGNDGEGEAAGGTMGGWTRREAGVDSLIPVTGHYDGGWGKKVEELP